MAYYFANSIAHSVVHRRCVETLGGPSIARLLSTAAFLSGRGFPFKNNGLQSVGRLAHSLLHRICAKGVEMSTAVRTRPRSRAAEAKMALEPRQTMLCLEFTQGKKSVSNQRPCVCASGLLTILSTKNVKNRTGPRSLLDLDTCSIFNRGKVIVWNQRLGGRERLLRTILSTKYVQKSLPGRYLAQQEILPYF